jgi:hypothetical protein
MVNLLSVVGHRVHDSFVLANNIIAMQDVIRLENIVMIK